MDIKREKFFSISAMDQPGELSRFSQKMSDAHVNLAGIWGFGIGQGKARITFIPKDPEHFNEVSEKAGLTVQEGYCFHLTGNDRVGVLAETLSRVSSEGINLHAVDAMALEGRFSCYVWAEDRDVEVLGRLLKSM